MAEAVASKDLRFRGSIAGTPSPEASGAEEGPDPLSAYLREVDRTCIPTRAEEKALLARLGRGDRAARNDLVTANLKVVVAICAGYRDRGLSFSDLIAEGNLGLIRAAQSYDIAQGRFALFAEWWIRRSVLRALEEQARFRAGAPEAPARIHARGNR